jgi:hypothetical protein
MLFVDRSSVVPSPDHQAMIPLGGTIDCDVAAFTENDLSNNMNPNKTHKRSTFDFDRLDFWVSLE